MPHDPLKPNKKVARARAKIARKANRKGGKGSSSHGTAIYTKAELNVQQKRLSGMGSDISKKKDYKKATDVEQKRIGEKKTSARQRAKMVKKGVLRKR